MKCRTKSINLWLTLSGVSSFSILKKLLFSSMTPFTAPISFSQSYLKYEAWFFPTETFCMSITKSAFFNVSSSQSFPLAKCSAHTALAKWIRYNTHMFACPSCIRYPSWCSHASELWWKNHVQSRTWRSHRFNNQSWVPQSQLLLLVFLANIQAGCGLKPS